MRLAEELKNFRCPDSPQRFRQRLIEAIQRLFPGWTIDDLVCDPASAIRFCEAIRAETGCEGLYEVVILKPLMNIRRSKNCPTGLKSRRRRTSTARTLIGAGCNLTAEQFEEKLVDALADMYRRQTIDGLVCHPNEAHDYCGYVRNRIQCTELTNPFILRTLMNHRKRGEQAGSRPQRPR